MTITTSTTTHEAYWATEGLFVIADAIKAKRGDTGSLVGSNGGADFVCPTFTMRSHVDSVAGTELPPNFEFHPAGFWISWYKYAGRSAKANMSKPPGLHWELAVADCIRAVEAWAP